MIANPKGCVGLEDVAALAEGRLSGAERERVVGHVAGCADCREVLAGVLKSMQEDAVGDDRAIERPKVYVGGPTLRWALVAIAATLALGSVVVIYQRLAPPEPPSRSEWLAAMPLPEQLSPHVWGGVVTRGAVDDALLPRQSAELGALLVDVEVVMAAREMERVPEFLRRMATILDQAGYMNDEVVLLRQTAEGSPNQLHHQLRSYLPRLESQLRSRFDPFYLDLGGFAEGARIAANARHTNYLRERGPQRYLNWLLTQGDESLPAEARHALQTLARNDVSPSEQAEAGETLLVALTR